jgi:hypothetical protein
MRGAVLATLLGAALATPALAAEPLCAPAKLVHVTITNVTPGIQAGTYAAQPRDIYRIGDGKQRAAEAADEPNHLHLLMVVAEPDIWFVNLYDSTGIHALDPGPTFYTHASVIPFPSLPKKLQGLEYGCEAEYIAANAPTPSRKEQVGAETFDVYRIVDGTDAVEILERPGAAIPVYARYYDKDGLSLALRYDRYETGLADDPTLFAPPPGIKFSDPK